MEDFYEKGKYYKPTIDEICISFECELYKKHYISKERIQKYIISDKNDFIADREGNSTVDEILDGFNDNDCIGPNYPIRVKYLDKEDIESLGWVYGGKSPEGYLGFNAKVDDTIYHLVIKEINVHINKAVPGERSDMGTSMRNSTLFNGKIKNKSELKFIMKCLNII